jgi:hypothetical protein
MEKGKKKCMLGQQYMCTDRVDTYMDGNDVQMQKNTPCERCNTCMINFMKTMFGDTCNNNETCVKYGTKEGRCAT